MRTVLHVLPHPGGGAETYIDLLEGMEGYRHRRVALSGTRSRGQGVPSVLGRRRKVQRLARSADLVHVHGDMAAMIAAPGLRGRPLVFTTHGLHRLRRSTGLAGWVVRRRLRTAVAATARTICIAQDERDDLAAALPAALRGRLVVVPNGVPVAAPVAAAQRMQARRALRLGDDEIGVLFVGQLEERKDPLGAIGAVEAARRQGADLVLLIAGGGPLEQQVAAAAGPAVRPLGHREDLSDLYAAADLFLLPSHREGMSFALLEAMAHGLAPVVADGTGNAETVGDAGVVFPAGDRGAMSARLAELAADRDARARLGSAARERIRTELSLERFLGGTRAQYEAAIAELTRAIGGPTQ
ncbi:MAG TPA: glycosyltransferase family 4 protein [Solirubrobacterales bacterium]|nr:glycosyltransferase family 4 protein [Solirubrobacterales bacterium]